MRPTRHLQTKAYLLDIKGNEFAMRCSTRGIYMKRYKIILNTEHANQEHSLTSIHFAQDKTFANFMNEAAQYLSEEI